MSSIDTTGHITEIVRQVTEGCQRIVRAVVQTITPPGQGQKALQAKADRYRAVADMALTGIVATDINEVLTYVNPAFATMIGQPAAELVGTSLPQLASLEIFTRLQEQIELTKEGLITQGQYETVLNRPDGQELIVLVSTAPLTATKDDYQGVVAVITNITERRQAEMALVEERNLLRTVIDLLPDYFFIKDIDGRLITSNTAHARLAGADTPEELVGKTSFDLFPEELAAQYHADDQAIIASGQPLINRELMTVDRQGNKQWLVTTKVPLRSQHGAIVGLVGISHNITQRKQAEEEREALLAAEHQQRLLAETLGEVTLALTSQIDLEVLFETILSYAQRLVPYRTAHIVLLEDDYLRIAGWEGYQAQGSDKLISNLRQPLAEFPLDAAVVQSRRPLVIPDTRKEPKWVIQDRTAWVRSHLVEPIVLGDRVLGLLRLDADTANAFSEEDIVRLQPLASAAAIALENARLYNQAQQELGERKQAETALRESEEKWRSLVENSLDFILITDRELRIQFINRTAPSSTREDVIGTSALDHAVPVYHELIKTCARRVFETGVAESFETEAFGPDGATSSYLVRLGPIKVGGETVALAYMVTDVSNLKQIQRALVESETRVRAIVEAAAEGIITINEQGIIESFNAAAVKIFGYEPAEAIGQNVSILIPEPHRSRHDDYIAEYLSTGESRVIDTSRSVMGQRKDNTTFPMNLAVSATWLGDQWVFTGIVRDLTERKALERQLLQAQKLEAIGQLAAGIAHEINTPAQYIGDNVGFVQESFGTIQTVLDHYTQLLQGVKAGPVSPEWIEEIETAIEQGQTAYLMQEIPAAIAESLEGLAHVTRIVQAMKEFSHPGVEGKTAININKAIESTITMARNEWKYVADLETDFEPNLPLVSCLAGEFNQVILNVLINAAHAIAEGVEDTPEGKGMIRVATRQDNDWVEIRISDTGPGIPAELGSRVFDPFFTTKDVGRGTGQGLAIAYSVIVEKHGGTITFETEPGQGTTFIIRIPIKSEAEALDADHVE